MSSELLLRRRHLLKASLTGAGFLAAGGATALSINKLAEALHISTVEAASLYIEAFPTSPLIMTPFNDPLTIPQALRPVPAAEVDTWASKPGPEYGKQDSDGGTHQLWPTDPIVGQKTGPLIYQIKVRVDQHSFTKSRVKPIGSDGKFRALPKGAPVTLGADNTAALPKTTIFGFNGTFPGPMINAEYGRAALVRFENQLDQNPSNLNLSDFGSPDKGFLTHLHNGHTAPESDGNPNYRCHQVGARFDGGYLPGQWVDNLYLNWPAGGDEREKQSFFWFHDHFHNHTSANVYKGLVALYPIYDPVKDTGDERKGLHLPGVRRDNGDGSFNVDYDIPLAFYDVRLEDGVTPHQDAHSGTGETRPGWWGQSFFKHFPNHGFIGDIFTVNGTAYPVLNVKRRKYRFRALDSSVSRIYDFKLMRSTGGPKAAADLGYNGDELQGQYRIPDGQQCMRFTQIASDGGLLPRPIVRDSFELWPAKRREVVVDFRYYQDGSPTTKGDVIYLTNTMKMLDGRKWSSPDPNYKVPVMKIVIGDDEPDSYSAVADSFDALLKPGAPAMRELPPLPDRATVQALVDKRRVFRLERGGGGGSGTSAENEWLINGSPFDEVRSFASPVQGTWEAWEIQNGGGGWVHPLHIHQEEHQVVMRNGKWVHPSMGGKPDARHPDDYSMEDVVAMDPSESVVFVRQFRDFAGHYVAHCHNLVHEDHSMMFGWDIQPKP
jgi:FtsP/CotA-like multicopper oxidase with cupredoxin domain